AGAPLAKRKRRESRPESLRLSYLRTRRNRSVPRARRPTRARPACPQIRLRRLNTGAGLRLSLGAPTLLGFGRCLSIGPGDETDQAASQRERHEVVKQRPANDDPLELDELVVEQFLKED